MKIIFSSLLITCLCISCTSRLYNSSSWQSTKITVDGKIPEWPNPLRFYDQETGINYCISNDRHNLYLVCSISNEFLQTKILQSGLEFGIDTMGKKSFPVSIKYPAGIVSVSEPGTNSDLKQGTVSDKKPDRSGFRMRLLAEATEMQLTGFRPQLGRLVSVSPPNNTGILAAINFDTKGTMNFEAVVPFSAFYRNELTPMDSNRVFNYEIKVNPSSKSNYGSNGGGGNRGGGMRSAGGMHGGGMRGGGMGGGGMRGGGMRGGGMNGNRMSGDGESSYQRGASISGTTKTTVKLKLAYR
jgi:hypothetical protein